MKIIPGSQMASGTRRRRLTRHKTSTGEPRVADDQARRLPEKDQR
jgi:hypothetical protein